MFHKNIVLRILRYYSDGHGGMGFLHPIQQFNLYTCKRSDMHDSGIWYHARMWIDW